MRQENVLMITADHGCDPGFSGTDHTREYVPFLAWTPGMKQTGPMEESDTFADIGATIADNFQVDMPAGTLGTSRLKELS